MTKIKIERTLLIITLILAFTIGIAFGMVVMTEIIKYSIQGVLESSNGLFQGNQFSFSINETKLADRMYELIKR
jgi:hypothetical protein